MTILDEAYQTLRKTELGEKSHFRSIIVVATNENGDIQDINIGSLTSLQLIPTVKFLAETQRILIDKFLQTKGLSFKETDAKQGGEPHDNGGH